MRLLVKKVLFFILIFTSILISSIAQAENMKSYMDLTLEELMDMEITSVSKKEEQLFSAAAAVYVVTAEDIRRSGVTSVPEALRLVPGVHVARIDSSTWAITARGFNSEFASNLLVLMDGRSIYTPLFSGVYWDVQDTVLEDVERIEVIRGPGATLWGANAVNGVINIITKPASDTQGTLVSVLGGKEEQAIATLRYGSEINEKAHYRVYSKYSNRGSFETLEGQDAQDEWDMWRGGGRLDWEISGKDSLLIQGDAYVGASGSLMNGPTGFQPPFNSGAERNKDMNGANILARWEHALSEISQSTLQLYYDHSSREEEILEERRDTFDLDFQHNYNFTTRNEFIWGLGYRYTSDEITNSYITAFYPESQTDHLATGFLQDTIWLLADELKLVLGSKFEHNDYTGFEVQPNVRLVWMPSEGHSLWGSVTRAVRTPARINSDVRLNAAVIPARPGSTTPSLISLFGNSDIESENLIAYELGYRTIVSDDITFDVAAFYNVYEDLILLESDRPFVELDTVPHLVIPSRYGNSGEADTYGVELASTWQISSCMRLSASYSFIEYNLDQASLVDVSRDKFNKFGPEHILNARLYTDLPHDLEFDTMVYYVDTLSDIDVSKYIRWDLRLGWRPSDPLELSLVWQNVVDSQHLEYPVQTGPGDRIEVDNALYGRITWRF